MEKNEHKVISREDIDDLVFLCVNVAVVAEKGYVEHVFMRLDFITFISIRYYDNGEITADIWKNRENPYAFLFRNEFGHLQQWSGKKFEFLEGGGDRRCREK